MRNSREDSLGKRCENEVLGLPCRKMNLRRIVVEGWLRGYCRNPDNRF